jgi:hypothetical protein
MKNRNLFTLAASFFIFAIALLTGPVLAETSAASTLPDFVVSNVAIKRTFGTNAGLYVFVTVENKGATITSQNYLSVNIAGLTSIGLPDGYVLYLTKDKTNDGYVYAKGYKKEFIGPRVDLAGVKQFTPIVTVDPGKYFTESDTSNNTLTKTLTVSNNAVVLAASAKEGKVVFDSGKNVAVILKNAGAKKNIAAQANAMAKYTEPIAKGSKINAIEKYAINNFIVYGTDSTKKITVEKRAAAVKAYGTAYNKIPVSVADWQIVILLLLGI